MTNYTETTPRHHRDIAKTSLRHHRDKTKTRPNITKASLWHHGDITETPPKRHWDITETSAKHYENETETSPWHHRNNTETSPKHNHEIPETSAKHYENKPETPPWHPETSPKQRKTKTDTSRRQDRDTTESMNFSILKLSPSTYGSQLHWFPKGAQYSNSNGNLRFCLETRSKCSSLLITKQSKHHHQRKKTVLQHQRDNTKPSPTHHQNITAPSPHITEISPKHARDVPNTSKHLKHHPTTYEPQLHWFAQRCTIYKFKSEFWILLRNPIKMFINGNHQTIKTPSPKKKNSTATLTRQHQAITHSWS